MSKLAGSKIGVLASGFGTHQRTEFIRLLQASAFAHAIVMVEHLTSSIVFIMLPTLHTPDTHRLRNMWPNHIALSH